MGYNAVFIRPRSVLAWDRPGAIRTGRVPLDRESADAHANLRQSRARRDPGRSLRPPLARPVLSLWDERRPAPAGRSADPRSCLRRPDPLGTDGGGADPVRAGRRPLGTGGPGL